MTYVTNTLSNVDIFALDNHIFFNGTTRNTLSMIDTRKEGAASGSPSFKNDAMINSMLVPTSLFCLTSLIR